MARSNILGALDLGTQFTRIIIVEHDDDCKTWSILGFAEAETRGLAKGNIINLEQTVEGIEKALECAEETAKVRLNSVVVGITGSHICGVPSNGVTAISRKDQEILQEDVDSVLVSAQAVELPPETEILHVLPQEYKINNQDGIKDPVGMLGVRLEARVHIVTAAKASVQNVLKCLERAGLEAENLVLESLASAHSIISEDERNLGVGMVEIGAGTTDVIVFMNGAIKYTGVIPVGGNHVTNDLAFGLRIPRQQAELLKKREGCAMSALVNKQDKVEVVHIGESQPKDVGKQDMTVIIQARMEELLNMVREHMATVGPLELLPAGVVLSGGSSLLSGTTKLAEHIFKCPTRLGAPHLYEHPTGVDLNLPQYSTIVGLVSYGLEQRRLSHKNGNGAGKMRVFGKVFRYLGQWLDTN